MSKEIVLKIPTVPQTAYSSLTDRQKVERIDTHLFIGGPLDGQQKALPPGTAVGGHVGFPTFPVPFHEHYSSISDSMVPTFGRVDYRRETLIAGDTKWDVWVLDGMTVQEAIAKLLADYRPEKAAVTP